MLEAIKVLIDQLKEHSELDQVIEHAEQKKRRTLTHAQRITLCKFRGSLEQLSEAASALSRVWEEAQSGIEDFEDLIVDAEYPLTGSFDEVSHDIAQYSENINEIISKLLR